MQYLQTILDNSQYGALTAFILGLMTAISPCPLATNISAIGFISRDIENRKRVFIKGLVYTLGRAISYTGLGVILFFGASKMHITMLFQGWGASVGGRHIQTTQQGGHLSYGGDRWLARTQLHVVPRELVAEIAAAAGPAGVEDD